MKKKYRNQHNYYHLESDYETITEASQTVQGDSYTITELMQRSIVGTLPNINRNHQYHEEANHDTDVRVDAPDFDLSDATSIKEEIEEKQKNAKENQRKKTEAHNAKVLKEKLTQELGSQNEGDAGTTSKSDLATTVSGEGETKPKTK